MHSTRLCVSGPGFRYHESRTGVPEEMRNLALPRGNSPPPGSKVRWLLEGGQGRGCVVYAVRKARDSRNRAGEAILKARVVAIGGGAEPMAGNPYEGA